jgi:hypothetical protein
MATPPDKIIATHSVVGNAGGEKKKEKTITTLIS